MVGRSSAAAHAAPDLLRARLTVSGSTPISPAIARFDLVGSALIASSALLNAGTTGAPQLHEASMPHLAASKRLAETKRSPSRHLHRHRLHRINDLPDNGITLHTQPIPDVPTIEAVDIPLD
jgi:hypothetical protein